jgi:hypothetical protein
MGVLYALLALINLLAGGFLATATYGFNASTTADIGFAVSIAVLVVAVAMGYVGYQSSKMSVRISLGLLGWLTAGLASWTVIATQVFAPTTSQWIVFGSGLGHIVLSAAGIITYEATARR